MMDELVEFADLQRQRRTDVGLIQEDEGSLQQFGLATGFAAASRTKKCLQFCDAEIAYHALQRGVES